MTEESSFIRASPANPANTHAHGCPLHISLDAHLFTRCPPPSIMVAGILLLRQADRSQPQCREHIPGLLLGNHAGPGYVILKVLNSDHLYLLRLDTVFRNSYKPIGSKAVSLRCTGEGPIAEYLRDQPQSFLWWLNAGPLASDCPGFPLNS